MYMDTDKVLNSFCSIKVQQFMFESHFFMKYEINMSQIDMKMSLSIFISFFTLNMSQPINISSTTGNYNPWTS